MKRSYQVALVLGLGGVAVGGFSAAYLLHAQQALHRFARESDRTEADYDFDMVWLSPADGSRGHPALLAKPSPESHASRDAGGRWKWGDPDDKEPCTAEDHRAIWRFGADRWEILEDLEADRSTPPFPDGDNAAN